jgi:hypothetical protein
MLASGVLGGLINRFLGDPELEKLQWWQHIIVGVGAAFIVPLFLNMISSSLINEIRGVDNKPPDFSKLFVLAGFCLVAAVSSRAFIQSISEKILQEVNNAKKNADQAKADAAVAKAAVAPLIEDETPPVLQTESAAADKVQTPELSDAEHAVLHALIHTNFSIRTLSGIAKDAGLDRSTANSVIASLVSKGLAAQTEGSGGHPRWYPTSLARTLSL